MAPKVCVELLPTKRQILTENPSLGYLNLFSATFILLEAPTLD